MPSWQIYFGLTYLIGTVRLPLNDLVTDEMLGSFIFTEFGSTSRPMSNLPELIFSRARTAILPMSPLYSPESPFLVGVVTTGAVVVNAVVVVLVWLTTVRFQSNP